MSGRWQEKADIRNRRNLVYAIYRKCQYCQIRKIALRKIRIPDELIPLEMDAILVPGIQDVGNAIPEDPSDHIFLSRALEGGADVIISGDRHLLKLKKFGQIPVMPVREFIDWFEKQMKA